MDKKSIRAKIKEKKAMLSQEEIQLLSLKIAEKLFELFEYKNADTVFVYMSYNQEVETDPIISRAFADGKRIALPRVKAEDGNGRKLTLNEQTMEFVFIDENTVFIENGGILEEGTHDELIEKNGSYANLFDVQSRYYKEGEAGHEEN